jgi:hypothetical protein
MSVENNVAAVVYLNVTTPALGKRGAYRFCYSAPNNQPMLLHQGIDADRGWIMSTIRRGCRRRSGIRFGDKLERAVS